MAEHLNDEQSQLLQEAQQALDQKNWPQAVASLEELYQSVSTLAINYRLVTALFFDEQYQLAADFLDDYLSDYVTEPTYFKLALEILLKNQHFVEAQELLNLAHPSEYEDYLQTIRQAEKEAAEQMAVTFETVARQFYHLSDYDLAKQEERYLAARNLPVDTFVQGAKYLLIDPFTSPVMRVTLMEDLHKLAWSQTISYRWLDDETYENNFAQSPMPIESSAYQGLDKIYQDQVAHQDPLAWQYLQDQNRLEISLLYPRQDELLTDLPRWAKRNQDRYYQRPVVKSKDAQDQLQDLVWQKINAFLPGI
ncbi:type I restriction endonuclease subunit R [Eupransor demetentiae]|uniref:Tetratricopeptide (TPR) repeat (TPR) n=1 Tax=Eupransor demetentiae TaxID=3109584 RepID=A0ABP0EPN4_9LACO|nr:Tetratricopeptide (TPR) repeat (TPR) [Lactobacillaceae bacterium LMG 33000]